MLKGFKFLSDTATAISDIYDFNVITFGSQFIFQNSIINFIFGNYSAVANGIAYYDNSKTMIFILIRPVFIVPAVVI